MLLPKEVGGVWGEDNAHHQRPLDAADCCSLFLLTCAAFSFPFFSPSPYTAVLVPYLFPTAVEITPFVIIIIRCLSDGAA